MAVSQPFSRMKLIGVVVACCLLAPAWAQEGYTFTTIAGRPGISGGTDGTNGAALFSGPAGLAVDARGDLYVTEDGNHTIRKLTRVGGDWVVTTLAGAAGQSGSADGTNAQARFYRPRGIAAGTNGAVFVVDSYNSTVRRLDPVGSDWVVTTIAGLAGVLDHEDGWFTNAFFRRPSGIAVNAAETLFIADMNNHVIRMMEYWEPEWVVSTIVGYPFLAGSTDGVADAAEFATPYSLAIAKGGAMYVADTGNNAIRRVFKGELDWEVVTIAGSLGAPAGTNDGAEAGALFNFPAGIAAGSSGTLFVSDQLNHTIRKLTQQNGIWFVSTIGGSPALPGAADGTGDAARFQRPWGIAVDSTGALYVADTRNHTIRRGVPSDALPRPILGVRLGVGTMTISWPIAAADYRLERSSSLEADTDWNLVTEPVVTGADACEVIIPYSSGAAFFRLKK